MITIDDTRRENLKRLFDEHGGAAQLARKLGYATPSFMSQVTGPKPTRRLTDKNARRYEEVLGLPEYWLDQRHDEPVVEKSMSAAVMSGARIADAIRMIGGVLQDEGVNLPSSKLTDVLALAVEDSIEHGGKMREDYVRNLVRLVK